MHRLVVNCETGEKQLVAYTAEEIAGAEAEAAAANEERAAREAEDAQRAADKESGNQKLIDLGLTDDEIAAITS